MRVGRRSAEPARVLVADPPWSFSDKLTMGEVKRGAGSNYSTMSLEEVKAFQPPCPVADDALLFLWSVAAMKEEALAVVRAWGFAPKSEIVWVKTSRNIYTDVPSGSEVIIFPETLQGLAFGMGRYVRNCHETCLIASRGKGNQLIEDRAVRSVFFAPAGRHSEKPEAFYGIVERLAGGPYVELFARRRRPGWHCFGDEL